jgi:probable phosphoglycerate mutase
VRLFVLTRHGRSTLNDEGRVNGDPTVPAPLTEEGVAAAARLGSQLAVMPLELCVHTRFARTLQTAKAVLGDRDVPLLEEPLLDDVDIGELEGVTIGDYRAWKRLHARSDPFPGGESLDDAARRYSRAFRKLLERPERSILVVCHEIPIRYGLNAAAGSRELDGPAHDISNATAFLFDGGALASAAARIDEITR